MYHSSLLLNGLQVLVVDSDSDSRDLLTTLFEMYGTLTLTATMATVALEILFQVKPDLLIGEIGLLKEDGYSHLRKVKALEKVRRASGSGDRGLQCTRESLIAFRLYWPAMLSTYPNLSTSTS